MHISGTHHIEKRKTVFILKVECLIKLFHPNVESYGDCWSECLILWLIGVSLSPMAPRISWKTTKSLLPGSLCWSMDDLIPSSGSWGARAWSRRSRLAGPLQNILWYSTGRNCYAHTLIRFSGPGVLIHVLFNYENSDEEPFNKSAHVLFANGNWVANK